MEYTSHYKTRASSLYEDQLRMGFGSLRFTDFLENEFREVYARENYQKSRLVLGMCTIVVAITTIVSVMSAEPTAVVSHAVFFLMACTLLATLGVSYADKRVLFQGMLFICGLAVGISGSIIDVQASIAGKGYYFAGQIGWLFIIWSMLGLQFTVAAILCAIVSSIYLALAGYATLSLEQMFFEGFMLLNVNLLGGYSCYKIEFAARRTFLESRILGQLAERDGLTGLYNRRAFDQYMERIWRQSHREDVPLTVMMIDIDHFKAYNDLYGHQAGDDALKQVASVISAGVQRPLDMAARYGGEEFALVLYGPASEYVMSLPELLREDVLELGTEHAAATHTKFMTISIGVAVINPEAGRSLAGAIQMADEALYQAKEDGRNRVVTKMSGTSTVETGRFRAQKKAG